MEWDPDTFYPEPISTQDGPLYRSPDLIQWDADPIGVIIQLLSVTLNYKVQSRVNGRFGFYMVLEFAYMDYMGVGVGVGADSYVLR